MRKSNIKKTVKVMIITAAVASLGVGASFVASAAEYANNDTVVVKTDRVVANQQEETLADVVKVTEKETTPVKATETQAETQTTTTVAQTEATTTTQAETTAKVAETQAATTVAEQTTPAETQAVVEESTTVAQVEVVDARVAQVIALINGERAAVGATAVTYDATLTTMAQVRASENADNDFFVIQNGKHMRPDGRTASSICTDFGQYGNFGEVMGRRQTSPEQIVEGWHNSAAHYSCMTSAKYTRVGVGVAADANGDLYWVAIFMN